MLTGLDCCFSMWDYSLQSESSDGMKVRVELPRADSRLQAAAALIPELLLGTSRGDASIEINGERRAAWVLERASTLPANLEAAVPAGAIGLVIGNVIPLNERSALQKAGLSWWDLRGSMHLQLSDKLVHIERPPSKYMPTVAKGRKLGPVGTRAVQRMLLGDDKREWSVSELADESGVSIGQAHSVVTLMEDNGLLQTIGKGAHKRRLLVDRDACLNWLLAQELEKRPPLGAWTYIYGRNEIDRARKFHELASERFVKYAFTSALAARVLGAPVTTGSVVTYVRVKAASPEQARRALGLEYLDAGEAGRGANFVLWADMGEVGTHDASLVNNLWVAPSVRVWLDLMRQGNRERDGAQLLKELLIDHP
jgi:hypothetical protein